MNTSVEISYYPLHNEFIPPIKDFIHQLNQYPDLVVNTSGMSTQVFGKYKYVMDAITMEIEKSFEVPHSVFILKIVNTDLQIHSKDQ